MSTPSTRRTFLKVRRRRRGRWRSPPRPSRPAGRNEKLNVGLIGCGNRGRTIIREVIKLGHNASPPSPTSPSSAWTTRSASQERRPRPRAGPEAEPKFYDDYRKLLDHKGLDAVIIATPDHHHKEQLLAAMAGRASTPTSRSR